MMTDGTLACWGDNTYGRTTPPSGTFASISAGYAFGCGVRARLRLPVERAAGANTCAPLAAAAPCHAPGVVRTHVAARRRNGIVTYPDCKSRMKLRALARDRSSIERFLRRSGLWTEPLDLAEPRSPPCFCSLSGLKPTSQIDLFEEPNPNALGPG
jgi:hypothetical protein